MVASARDQAGTRTGLDRHVADRHAFFHRQGLDRAASVFEYVASAAVDADRANDVQHQILGGDSRLQLAAHVDRERLRLALEQTLRRQDMADLGRADAERKRAECTVRRRVTVAADDRHARLGRAQLRPDHVHDAAMRAAPAVQLDAELARIGFELRDLGFSFRGHVGTLARRVGRQGWRGMIERRQHAIGPAHASGRARAVPKKPAAT